SRIAPIRRVRRWWRFGGRPRSWRIRWGPCRTTSQGRRVANVRERAEGRGRDRGRRCWGFFRCSRSWGPLKRVDSRQLRVESEKRKTKNRNSKLETRNSKLETRNSKLETRNSKLETR